MRLIFQHRPDRNSKLLCKPTRLFPNEKGGCSLVPRPCAFVASNTKFKQRLGLLSADVKTRPAAHIT